MFISSISKCLCVQQKYTIHSGHYLVILLDVCPVSVKYVIINKLDLSGEIRYNEKIKYKRIYNNYYDGIIKNAEMFEEMSAECNNKIEIFVEQY